MPLEVDFDDFLESFTRHLEAILGVKKGRINPKTKINGSLGVDGADADELLMALNNKYNLKIIEFDYDQYFGPELGYTPIWSEILRFGMGRRTKALTVEELGRVYFSALKSQAVGQGKSDD